MTGRIRLRSDSGTEIVTEPCIASPASALPCAHAAAGRDYHLSSYVQCPVLSSMGEGMISTRKWVAVLTATALLGIAVLLAAQQQQGKPANGAPRVGANAATGAASGAVARGKYLVEGIAYCTNCHTPRNSQGELDRSKWLQGGPLFWQPAHPLQNYPQLVPRIAGTIPATDDEMVTLLTTGVWKDGTRLREPMPQFRFSKEDAQAVIAYLKTLNSATD